MHLQGDESGWRQAVPQISGGHAVEPGLDGIAAAFDTELVPLASLERFARGFVAFQIIQPAAPAFVIYAASPRAIRRINLHLIAVHATGGDFDRLAIPRQFRWLVETVAANLHARVEAIGDFVVQLQHDVRELAPRAEERIRRIRHRRAYYLAVFDTIFRLAATLNPTIERLAVKKRNPASVANFVRGITDTLRHELPVIRIVVGGRAVAELQINHARLPLRARPRQRIAALGVRGRDQWRHVWLRAKTDVNLIEDREIFQARRDRVIRRNDFDRHLDIVLKVGLGNG